MIRRVHKCPLLAIAAFLACVWVGLHNGRTLAGGSASQSDSKILIHRPIFPDPYIPRLTEQVATSVFSGRRLLGLSSAGIVRALYQKTRDDPLQGALFMVDPIWERILYSQSLAVIKSWGQNVSPPEFNLRTPIAMAASSGHWEAADEYIQLYVAESAPPRVLRMFYHFGINSIGNPDSLSLDADGLSHLTDCELHDSGTSHEIYDDEVWVLDLKRDGDPQFVTYRANAAPHGVKDVIELPVGDGEGLLLYPSRFTFGRNFLGNTEEVYVLDRNAKVVQYHLVGNTLEYENEYDFVGAGLDMIEPVDVTVDAYGQVYVVSDIPSSRVYKFAPDLQLLGTFENEGTGDDQLLYPLGVHNARPTPGSYGFGDVYISEFWSQHSGGQRYGIGVEMDLIGSVVSTYSAELTYHATDPHYLDLKALKLVDGDWELVTDQTLMKYSGNSTAQWSVPESERGFEHTYKLLLIGRSTYANYDDGTPASLDTLELVAAMGNEGPHVTSELRGIGLINGCVYYKDPGWVHSAALEAADDYTEAQDLIYTWTDLSGQATFQVPGTLDWVAVLTGPYNTVDFGILWEEKSGRRITEPDVVLHVTIEDGGGGSAETSLQLGVCDLPIGSCNCNTCDCPHQCDYDDDGFLTASDVGTLIDVLFAGHPEIQDPGCPTSRGDFNCDGFPTTLDLGGLIDHLFAGGDPPCDPCAM